MAGTIIQCVLACALTWVGVVGQAEEEGKNGFKGDLSQAMPYYIMEELPANTPIGNVAIDFKLDQHYTKVELGQLTYRFLRQSDAHERMVNLFGIGNNTGIIRTAQQIDRDAFCGQAVSCFVFLDIRIGPAQFDKLIKIKVDILDKNDHAPLFLETEITKKIPESMLPGMHIKIATATDPDSLKNGIQEYELVSSSNKFGLDFQKTDDGIRSLDLVLKGRLDREAANFYQFKIVAKDGGKPQLTGTLQVNIEVEDANDNDPRFDNATYEVYVLENMDAGTNIARVKAEDLDIGNNGKLSYGFTERTQTSFGDRFVIQADTGVISLKQSLDFEAGSTYLLVVTAHDGGPDSLPARATVIVRVEDENDNAPEVTVRTMTPDRISHVHEEAEIGTFVAHVSVRDQDGGNNGRVECGLDNTHFNLERVYQTQFKVVTALKLNREAHTDYVMHVSCHDLARVPKTTVVPIEVKVIDANDHPPVFTAPTYSVTIGENNFVGDVIIQVNATDRDAGPNGMVEFKLHPTVTELFKIHRTQGVLTANAIFDHETLPSLEVRVIAYDLGVPSLSSTATVLLTVSNADDEPPVFSQSSYAFGTYENQPPGADVGALKAVDPDGPPFNNFVFKMGSASSAESLRTFSINPMTGKLRTKAALDREEKSVYYLQVVASSGKFSALSSTASVTVYVADKNDNDPVIHWPYHANNTIYVPSMAPQDHAIARIVATDEDIGDNGNLKFYITQGNVGELFSIGIGSGVVSITGDMSQIAFEEFTLRIHVKDGGYPERTSISDLHVVVNQSLVYQPPALGSKAEILYTNNNVTVIVSLTSASLILIALLIGAILLIRRHVSENKAPDSPTSSKVGLFGGREAQQMLSPRDDLPPDGGESVMVGTHPSLQGVNNMDAVCVENEKNLKQDIDFVTDSRKYEKASPTSCEGNVYSAEAERVSRYLQEDTYRQQRRQESPTPACCPDPHPPQDLHPQHSTTHSSSSFHPGADSVSSSPPPVSHPGAAHTHPPPHCGATGSTGVTDHHHGNGDGGTGMGGRRGVGGWVPVPLSASPPRSSGMPHPSGRLPHPPGRGVSVTMSNTRV